MAKEINGNPSQDLDIFGDSVEKISGVSMDDADVLGTGSDDQETGNEDAGIDVLGKSDEPTSDKESDDKDASNKSDSDTKDDSEESALDSEIEDLLKDLISNNEEISSTVDDIQEKAKETGNDDLMKLIEDLQKQLTDSGLTNSELKRQLEVSNSRYLDKVGEVEGMSIYSDMVEKLEGNPKMMMLVKYMGNPNDVMKGKLTKILSDFLFDITGQDVYELLESKEKAPIEAVLNPGKASGSGGTPNKNKNKPEEEKDSDFYTNNLFG